MSQNQQQPISNNSFLDFRAAFSRAFQSTMPRPRSEQQGTAADPVVVSDEETQRLVVSDVESDIQILNSLPQRNQTTRASTNRLQQPVKSSPHSASDTRQGIGRHSLGVATAINLGPRKSSSLASRSPSPPGSRASSSKIDHSAPGPKKASGSKVSLSRAESPASGSSTAPPKDAEISSPITPRPSLSRQSLPSTQLSRLNSNQGSPTSQMDSFPQSAGVTPTSTSLREQRQSPVSNLVSFLPFIRRTSIRHMKNELLQAIKTSVNNGAYELPEGETAMTKAQRLAIEIEDALHKSYSEDECRKRTQWLVDIFKTKQEVCDELLSQIISPLGLATMSIDAIGNQPSATLNDGASVQETSNEDIEMEEDDSRTTNLSSRTRSRSRWRRTVAEGDIEMEDGNPIADLIDLVDKAVASQETGDEDAISGLRSYALSDTPSRTSSRNKSKSQKSADTIGSSSPLIMRLREDNNARRRDPSPREVMAKRSASREGESDGKSEAILQYEESFQRLKQTIFDDHALSVRWLLFDAKQPCKTTETDFVDETSPFESMGAVRSSDGGLASGSYSVLKMETYKYKKKVVKSRSQLIARYIITDTPRVPRYNAHTAVQRNILTGDATAKLKFIPFLEDTWDKERNRPDPKKEAGRMKMERELYDAYSGGVSESRRDSERLWQIRPYLDDWIKDMNIGGGIDSLTQYAFDEAGNELVLGPMTRKLIAKSFEGPLSPELIETLERISEAFGNVFEVPLKDVMLPKERVKEMAEAASSTNRGTPIRPATALQGDSRLGTYTTLTCLICGVACCQTHGEYNDHTVSNDQPDSDEEINTQEGTEYVHERVVMNYDDLLRKHDSRPNQNNDENARRFSRPCSKSCYLLEGELHDEYEWAQEDLASLRSMLITLNRNGRLPCDLAFILSRPCWQVRLEIDKVEPRNVEVPLIGRNKRPEWYDNKRKVLKSDWQELTSASLHQERSQSNPCAHAGPCQMGCPCFDDNILCETYCGCTDDCPRKFTGCSCVANGLVCVSDTCICIQMNRECGPKCSTCGAIPRINPVNKYDDDLFKTGCQNIFLQRGVHKKLILGESQLEGVGFGLYMGEPVQKGDFISEYAGEVISSEEAERRGIIYDHRFVSFLFDLNADWCIDAARFGNKTRFINHASCEADGLNVSPKIVFVNGEHRIKFFALRDIAPGEELLFDYGKNFAEKQGLNKKLPKSILGGKKGVIEGGQALNALDKLNAGNQVRRTRRKKGKASTSRGMPTIPTMQARKGRGKARKRAPEKQPVIEMDEMAVEADEYVDDEEEAILDNDEGEGEDEDIGEGRRKRKINRPLRYTR